MAIILMMFSIHNTNIHLVSAGAWQTLVRLPGMLAVQPAHTKYWPALNPPTSTDACAFYPTHVHEPMQTHVSPCDAMQAEIRDWQRAPPEGCCIESCEPMTTWVIL